MTDALKKLTTAGSGRRTYVLGGGLILLGVAVVAGVEIPEDTRAGLWTALSGAAAITLRAAVAKLAGDAVQ